MRDDRYQDERLKNKTRNPMMDQPVINREVRDFLRMSQKPLTGYLLKIQQYAEKQGIPIIPRETVHFLAWLLPQIQPKSILEIGTAIGFSASLFATNAREAKITTIERNPQMSERAKKVFAADEFDGRINLIEGDAVEVLSQLQSNSYDLIFMDSAKAKYIEFLPECVRLLKNGGNIIIDDILQGGTILKDEADIPRRVRKIHRKLNELLDTVLTHEALTSTIIPLGDGLLLITVDDKEKFLSDYPVH